MSTTIAVLPEPLQQGFIQLLRIDRLADVLVHAGGETGLPILVEGVGGPGLPNVLHPISGSQWQQRRFLFARKRNDLLLFSA